MAIVEPQVSSSNAKLPPPAFFVALLIFSSASISSRGQPKSERMCSVCAKLVIEEEVHAKERRGRRETVKLC